MHVVTGLGVGGAERMLARLVLAPRTDPIETIVVSLLDAGGVADTIRAGGVPVAALGMRPGRLSPAGIWRLARLIRRHAPDVVQGWMYHADLCALAALALSGRRRRTRLYWGIRCSDLDLSRYSRVLRAVIGLCARLSPLPDGVMANSQAGLAHHLALGYRPRLAGVIANGVDCGVFRPSSTARERLRRSLGLDAGRVVAILPARLDPMKDHGSFLAALDQVPEVTGVAVGTGTETLPERDNLRSLGCRDDMPDLLAAADIVVSSSAYGEGFCNALAEGMAAGLPAVATRTGDSQDIVGEAGIVVPPKDPAALAVALRTLAADDGLRHRLGAQARARIETRFSLGQAVAAFDRLHRDGVIG